MPDWDVYRTDKDYGRSYIIDKGSNRGEELARTDYPHAVYRDEQGATREAERVYTLWLNELEEKVPKRPGQYEVEKVERFHSQKGEMKRLFVSAFVGSYLDWIRKADARRVPQPQPQPPATPSNIATLKGVTLTLKDVDHNTDECVYYVEVEDPGYLDGVLPAEIYSPLGEAEQAQASGSYGIAASDTSPSYQASYTPLPEIPASRKSKGTRLYVRNVKKK